MPLRINSQQITTSRSPHKLRALRSSTSLLNHGLGFSLHPLPKTRRPCCCYMVELATTRGASIACLLMAAARHIKCKGLSQPSHYLSRTSSAYPSIINSHQSHLHGCKSHTVINMCHAITGHRWKWHSHRRQRHILPTNLNSTASHKTAMHTIQHRSLHAPTKHRRCTPCNHEYCKLLVTIHVTLMCNEYLQ